MHAVYVIYILAFYQGSGDPPMAKWWSLYRAERLLRGGRLMVLQGSRCKLNIDKSNRVPVTLVGGLEHFLFFHILGIIIPIDYFSEGLKPPTRVKLEVVERQMVCDF